MITGNLRAAGRKKEPPKKNVARWRTTSPKSKEMQYKKDEVINHRDCSGAKGRLMTAPEHSGVKTSVIWEREMLRAPKKEAEITRYSEITY